MWDMTNVLAYKFTDGAIQRGTYSSYYGENCFKGGVFCQLCGWLGNEELWGGGVSDLITTMIRVIWKSSLGSKKAIMLIASSVSF